MRNSFLVNVSATHRDPDAAALIANRYVAQFIAYLIDNVSGKNDDAVAFLQLRVKELREASSAADQKLLAYMERNNLVSLDSSVNIVSDRLKSVNGALQEARLSRLGTEDLYRQVATYRQEGKNLLELSYIATHGTVPSLREQVSELARNQSVLSERYLEKHPRMIDLANSMAAAQGQLQKASSSPSPIWRRASRRPAIANTPCKRNTRSKRRSSSACGTSVSSSRHSKPSRPPTAPNTRS